MAIHLTRIYTRVGDDGTSALSNFDRVPKYDSRLEAYADVEEANCVLGEVLALSSSATGSSLDDGVVTVLQRVQNELFDCGADLATPIEENPKYPPLRVEQAYIDRLEQEIDRFNEPLGKLRSFILPGGDLLVAKLHTARVVTRRAERRAWKAIADYPDTTNPLTAKYLNRLSDLLFVLCRVAADGDEVLWVPGGER